MKKRVFITGCCFRAPGLKDLTDIIRVIDDPKFKAPFKEITLTDTRKSLVAKLDLDKTSLHYPSGSLLKILRSDVIAALICSGELMEQAGLNSVDVLDVPLYISNGSSFDLSMEQLTEITAAFLKKSCSDEWSDRYQRVYSSLPPMYVLRTLENAAECFVSQKTGAKGDNATFGGSSHSTYYVLLEALRKIENNEADLVLVGACNGIGVFSALIYANLYDSDFKWRESEGVGFFLLESEESITKTGRKPLAEITSLRLSKNIPVIFSDNNNELPYQCFDHDLADFCIYSGGLSESDHSEEEKACQNKWSQSFSWFTKLGIMGNNAIVMNMATSIAMFKYKKVKQIDCLNRDPYGRESFIKLKTSEI
jgi:hypothetical protein